jgi:hypothetical protein
MEIQKNITKPSIRTKVNDTTDFKNTESKNKDFIWYLKNVCGGVDKYEFDTHDDAYKFGWALRDKHGDAIKVTITVTTVRVCLASDTPPKK